MIAIDTGLYTALAADVAGTAVGTLGQLGATGVYRMVAPQTATTPYVVFGQQSGIDSWTFNDRDHRSTLYLVKAVGDGHSGSAVAAMNNRLDTVLNDKPLTMSGWTCERIRRESDVEYVEVDAGITYQHAGGLFRVDVSS